MQLLVIISGHNLELFVWHVYLIASCNVNKSVQQLLFRILYELDLECLTHDELSLTEPKIPINPLLQSGETDQIQGFFFIIIFM